MPWWLMGSFIVCSILVVLFLAGAFFMTRSYLRKMKKERADRQGTM
ncbi:MULTISPECIES: hypothetical protein [Alicyclobacillus]|nr:MULTISPECIES: hypothetical protein [Alicyclobacillus]MCL6627658.1 hypothetical protein [Alicyclobacillus shizuokensis]